MWFIWSTDGAVHTASYERHAGQCDWPRRCGRHDQEEDGYDKYHVMERYAMGMAFINMGEIEKAKEQLEWVRGKSSDQFYLKRFAEEQLKELL